MKRIFIISLLALSSFAVAEPTKKLINTEPTSTYDIPSSSEVQRAEEELKSIFGDSMLEPEEIISTQNMLLKYNHIDPGKVVPRKLLSRALAAFDQNQENFPNDEYITVMDFSTRSNKVRFFVINMNSGSVWSLRTAHGAGGDPDHDGYVDEVSNISGSHMSSKGFYRVSEVYYGKYGRSIRLDGLSSTNSRARPRAIVLHGGDYVKEANVIQGRSWGCFVFDWAVKDDVVTKIAGGSLLYADFSEDY